MRFTYTEQQVDFLRKKCPKMSIEKLVASFNARFGMNKTKGQIKSTFKNHHITSGRPKGNPMGTYREYTKQQARFIRTGYRRLSISKLTYAFNVRFGTNKTIGQIYAFARNHEIRSGRTGCFEPGQKPWNTGTKGKGICKGNSGSFKKGNVPANVKPLGYIRIDSKDGYELEKVAERNPYTGFPTRFRPRHVLFWERKYGPVPEGKIVVFKDSSKRCVLKNLMLVTRAELLHMNKSGYGNMPEELKPSLLALVKLRLKIGGRVKQHDRHMRRHGQ